MKDWLGLAVVLALGCGDSGPSADKACGDLAQARCVRRASCTNGTRVTRDYGDMTTCVERERLACINGLGAPKTGNTPSGVESCAAALPSVGCDDFFLNNLPSSCIAVGQTFAAGTCAFNGQCQTSLCAVVKGTTCGTCQGQPSPGASCATVGCGRGLDCSANTMVCVAPGNIGTLCDADHPCLPDLSCQGASSASMGMCVAAVAMAGQPCGNPVGQPGCNNLIGLRCNAKTHQCGNIAYVGDRMPCGTLDDGSFAACSGGGLCVIPTGQAIGACKAPAADGGACDTDAGPPCLAPARCVTGGGTATAGNCRLPDPVSCG
jgi:hypothetical protein